MVIVVMLFILGATGLGEKVLRLFAFSFVREMQALNLCGNYNKIAGSQYGKRFTIWELGVGEEQVHLR
jgi:hypothetical protein